MTISESMYYGSLGYLFASDVRYNPADRAHCNPLPDGRVQFRLHAESDLSDAVLIYNDGTANAVPMQEVGQDGRFRYWEAIIAPTQTRLNYSFAFLRPSMPAHSAVYWGGRGLTHAVETPFTLDLVERTPFTTPDWVKGAVVYQIFPERFASGRAETTPANAVPWGTSPAVYQFQGGDLHGIAQNIDYLVDLGIDIIYLNPINTALSNHKYDAVDFYHVDPAFGGDAALHELVEAAHRNGIKIILDASFNHCYPQFAPFQDVVQNGVNSPYKDWFRIDSWPVQVVLRSHLLENHPEKERFENWFANFRQTSGVPVVEVSDSDGPLVQPSYEAWFGVINMPKLNQNNPATRAYFLDVAQHWLREFGVDGWRMDVAQHVVDDFWVDFRKACLAINPEAYLLAEIWGNTSFWLQGDMFDATMNYLFRDLCVGYFARCTINGRALLDGLTRLEALYAPQVTAVNQNLLSSHDVPRFVHLSGEQTERFRLATLFKLTMPGVPSIYYGDEIGMTGGHDPDNRRAFPWHERGTWDVELREFIKTLIRLRKEHPALRWGSWRGVWAGQSNDALVYMREYEGERIMVVINRQGWLDAAFIPVETAEFEVLLGRGDLELAPQGLVVRYMRPWSGLVVRCLP